MKTKPLLTAWISWLALSLAILASLIAIDLWKGPEGIGLLTPTGPLSNFWLTVFAAAFAWLLGGLLLWLLQAGRIDRANLFTWAGFFLVSLLYVNLLRERLEYGDLESYIRGATNLVNHEPFDNLYIYPPLWAMLLKPLVPLGEDAFLYATWILNVLMLMAFYFLLHRVLERYGFTPRLAALAVTVFMTVSMPLLRTMFYLQVNLHVLNLVLVSLLAYPRARWLSALALALAIHLKVSPAALVLAFLLERDWRWLAWLAFFLLAVFGVTVLSDGIGPYFDYLRNLGQLGQSHALNFRETSFDSFFWSLSQLLRLPPLMARIAIYACKALLAAAALVVLAKAVRRNAYYQGGASALMNALPPLMVLMYMFSPLVWEHHAVFLALPFLVLLRGLETPAEWTWFGCAYFLACLIPAIDFFPWSYLRMLVPWIVLWLCWRAANRPGETTFFRGLNQGLQSMTVVPGKG
jgi:hypothetical protein